MARICRLLRLFWDLSHADPEEEDETPQACECDLQELLRLLDEESAAVAQEFEYAEKVNAERAAIERDACLAPEGETWRRMLRQESALDRSIDRKVKMILGMRKTYFDDSMQELIVRTNLAKGDAPEMEDIEPTLGCDIPSEDPTLEPPEPQNARNKPGMSMKTKGESRSRGVEKSRSQAVESRQRELAQASTSASDGC